MDARVAQVAAPIEERLAPRPLLVPGRTCWRVESAERVAFVIDGESYFRAAFQAMRAARYSIALLAWDLDLRIRPFPGVELTLREFLDERIAERPELYIRVLLWDMANALALARPTLPPAVHDWLTGDRLRIVSDSAHPAGSCHHQKVLIVDDAVAFCGGIDLAGNRWDTRRHHVDDPRRILPDGTPCEPRHDLMMAVDGKTAHALGELFRERWRVATGEVLEPSPPVAAPWPASLGPDLRDVPVGIARTKPTWNGSPAVYEVEALYLESIARAQRFIYIENQYFASRRIAEALARRLGERRGPEVVIVTSNWGPSWIEHQTMNALRDRLVHELRKADRYGRFRIYAAFTGGTVGIIMHGKVMVVDDCLLRIGSSNINDRSLGSDTECDLAIEATAGDLWQSAIRRGIRRFLHDVLAEHLCTVPNRVARTLEAKGSLIRTIEVLRGDRRQTLRPLKARDVGPLVDHFADNFLFNPSRPPWRTPQGRRVRAGLLGAVGSYLLWRAFKVLREPSD